MVDREARRQRAIRQRVSRKKHETDLFDDAQHVSDSRDPAHLVAELAGAPTGARAQGINRLQSLAGNQSVVSVLRQVQREAADVSTGQPAEQVDLQPVEQNMPLPVPDPIAVSPDDVGSGMGDYEVPDQSNQAMAKHVQRDDDKPGLRGDVSGGAQGPIVSPPTNPQTGPPPAAAAPFSVSSSVVLKNVDLLHVPSLHLDIGHEPSLTFQVDPASGLSAQAAIALLNVHWMPVWNHEVEVSLSPFIQTTLVPLALSQAGIQLQAEQHLTGTVSLTLSATGAYQPPQPGQFGGLSVTGGAGVLVHLDWDKIL